MWVGVRGVRLLGVRAFVGEVSRGSWSTSSAVSVSEYSRLWVSVNRVRVGMGLSFLVVSIC